MKKTLYLTMLFLLFTFAISCNQKQDSISPSSLENIFEAAKIGTVQDVRYFVEKKRVNINSKDISAWTPLHYALTRQNIDDDVVKYLVEKGSDVNAESSNGRTPLRCAISNLNTEVDTVKYLVEKGADVNAKDFSGQTSLHHAVDRSFINDDIVTFLIEKGAIPMLNRDGLTPFELANTKEYSTDEEKIKIILRDLDINSESLKQERIRRAGEQRAQEQRILEKRAQNPKVCSACNGRGNFGNYGQCSACNGRGIVY